MERGASLCARVGGRGADARGWAAAAAHQTAALVRADRALEVERPGFRQDLEAALTYSPSLAQRAGTALGLRELLAAGQKERAGREKLEERARMAVRTWGRLDAAYQAAEKVYDWQAQRELAGQLERFGKALTRQPQLLDMLRERGPEFELAESTRLSQALRSRAPEEALAQELGLRQRGPSLGLGR